MSKVYVVPEKSPLPENDGPPTIATPYGLCGRCGKQSRFKEKEQFLLAHGEPYRCAVTSHNATSKMILFYCRNCLQEIIEIEEVFANNQRVKRLGHTSGRRIWKGTYWWPQAQILAHESVPDGIKEAFAEAANCFQSGYYRASAVMSRRTLEAVVEDHEIECKNLYDVPIQLRSATLLGVGHCVSETEDIGSRGTGWEAGTGNPSLSQPLSGGACGLPGFPVRLSVPVHLTSIW